MSEDVDEPVLEGTGRRRLAISALLVLILLGILVCLAPDSAIKSNVLGVARPFLFVTGLDQRWGMFSPNPRVDTNDVVVRVERADGTVGVYAMGSGDGLSEYWNYRWLKYGEQLWSHPGVDRERRAFVEWIADQDGASGHQPVRVTLVRLTRTNLPPGPGPDTGPWREVPFYTTSVGQR